MTKLRKLNRPTGHRLSMLRTMVSQLVKHERIETTVAKAKEVRRLADNMVQLGKESFFYFSSYELSGGLGTWGRYYYSPLILDYPR
nr:ribosomal protein L17 family protein [Ipomoea batatas]